MEKVINEFRVIETDDGYRIEIKGDKEAMRNCLKHAHGRMHCGMHGMPFFGRRAHFWRHGYWCCDEEEKESEEEKA